MTFGENIVEVYRRASDAEREAGMTWYNDAHNLALDLSPNDVWKGAGVIVALSPLKSWNLNMRLARMAFDTGIATGNIGQHNDKAQAILDGLHALDVIKGDKTRNFCIAIATNGESDIAVIDRHAHDIAMGKVFTDSTRNITKSLYRRMAMHYGEAAKEVGVSVNQLQAITWIRWRNEKGIK